MTCAMRIQDPCDGAVECRSNAEGAADVPFCQRHYFAWRGHVGPFEGWTRKEREKWARWAAGRAARQANCPKNLEGSI